MKNKKYRGSNVFMFLIILLLAFTAAFAQTTASITGTITDDTGAVVPGVAVTVTNIGVNQSNNGDSRNPDRVSINPNFTGPRTTGNPNQWFNPAAFLLPAAGTYGNAGRDILTGPPLTEFDMSLFKTTAITEKLTAQFRAEAFNLFNHANFGIPVVSTFSNGQVSPTAGAITYTATSQRELQFGLKLLW